MTDLASRRVAPCIADQAQVAIRKMRMQRALGNLGERVGAYFLGGFALTLRHRHDIRVGIASGMFLKAMIQDVPTRLEILAVLYLCRWRWPTKVLLETVAARMGEYLRGNSCLPSRHA